LSQWEIAVSELLVGFGFCLGILLLNLPQHYICWKYRSAEGLSLAYILICTVSSATLFLATLLGDYHVIGAVASRQDILPGQIQGQAEAAPPLESPLWILRAVSTLNACMPTLQNLLCLLVGVPSLAVYYFGYSKPEAVLLQPSQRRLLSDPTKANSNDNSSAHSNDIYIFKYSDGTEHELAHKITIITWLVVLLACSITAAILWTDHAFMEYLFVELWGSTAAITNLILYFPQIITTFRNQDEGVLSLASLAISVVGDIAQGVYWIKSTHESAWVYSSLAVDAGMQLVLIAMIIDFRIRRWTQQEGTLAGNRIIYSNLDLVSAMDTDSSCSSSSNNNNQPQSHCS
jgi:uncharacterized protein with PQ loop repeat